VAHRSLRKDSTGFYIKLDNRVFRPAAKQPTQQTYRQIVAPVFPGEPVSTTRYNWSQDDKLWVWQQQTTPGSRYGLSCLGVWETTDPAVPRKKSAATIAKEQEQYDFKRRFGGVNLAGVVAASGEYTYAGRKYKKDVHLAMNGGASMTWAEWDDLVAEIERARAELPLKKIAAKLEADLAADDELQAFLKEKGLIDDG
jgi:hypothetical protein